MATPITLSKDLIKGFVGSCLVKGFDGSKPIPNVHEEIWELCCSESKYVAMALPRGHGKSTAITFAYIMAALLFRQRKFAIIISDSEYQASMFLGQIKTALTENEDIINLFKIKRGPKGVVEFIKETESDIIVETEDGHKFRVIAKGSEQKLRGLLWNGSRPDLMILDDMESDEQVMNKDRRDKFRKWMYGALIPALSEHGIIRYVGTILHQDSALENLMPKPNAIFTKYTGLKTYSERRIGLWTSVKYKAHNEDFSEILWPDRWTKQGLMELKDDYMQRGMPEQYSQEYLNIPVDESTAFFKKNDLVSDTADDKKKLLNYYIAADLAISERDRADYTVFLVGGMDEAGILHIRNVVRGRFDGMEIVETLLALQRTYNPIAFGIEDMQVTKAIGPYLNRAMVERNTYLNILLMKPHKTDKQTRAQSIRARMRASGVKFDKQADWYPTFEDELLSFPRSRHDDQVDSLAYLGLLLEKMIDAPTQAEQEEMDYLEDVGESNLPSGRNEITGY
jgi:predicted phage terminase large subunit-like protein